MGNFEFKNIEDVVSLLKQYSSPVTFVGDGSVLYEEFIKNNLNNCNFCDKNDLSSVSLGIAGLNSFKNGKQTSLMPLYLRKSQAERALEEKLKI